MAITLDLLGSIGFKSPAFPYFSMKRTFLRGLSFLTYGATSVGDHAHGGNNAFGENFV